MPLGDPSLGAELSRRRVLAALGASSALAFLDRWFGHSAAAQEAESPALARARRLLAASPAFDLHCHPGLFATRGLPGYGGDGGVSKTTEEMVAGQLAAGFFSLVADVRILRIDDRGPRAARRFEAGEAWADYERQIAGLKELLELLPAALATRFEDVARLRALGKVAAFVACEGGDLLEGRVDRLERLHADGVRSVQLVHYAPNELGDLQTEAPVHGGLSPAGRDVVREMNRLGMVVDVAHASLDTARGAVEISTAPMILSHSQLAGGEWQSPRLITPEHARLVAQTGGVIGVWPSGLANGTFTDFVDNTLRLVEVVGIDSVGFSTDMDGNFRPVFASYLKLPDFAAGLVAKGLAEDEVAKLVGGNALRVLKRVAG